MSFNCIKRALATVVLVLLPLQANAAKIGFVDAVKLVETAPQGKQAMAKLETEFGIRETKLRKAREELLAKEQTFEKNKLLMADKDQAIETDNIRNLQRDVARAQAELREDFNLARNKELAVLQKVVTQAVIDIAKEEKYDLIVQQAVWYSPETDMTSEVLKRLEKMYKK